MRRSPDFGWLGACVLITAAVSLISALAAAQTVGQSAGGTARTAWGDPDLQGVWDFSSNTPLNRPEEFGDRAFLTEEEAAQRQQVRIAARDTQDNTAARAGDTGTYNRFWTDNPRETRHTSLVVDPPNGRVPPLTPAAQRRFEELAAARRGVDDDAPTPGGFVEDLGPRGLFVRCLMGFNSGPPMKPQSYNQNIQIFQTPEHVVLLNEMVHSSRVVPLGDHPELADGIRQWLGSSRGRWEGDSLVVTTTNFRDTVFDPNRSGGGHRPGGSALVLVERFTRSADDALIYEFTMNDPAWYTAPWTARLPMARSDQPLYEFACHEGNYGLENILAGARRAEQLPAESR